MAPAPAATPISHSTSVALALPGNQVAQVTLAITVELSAGGRQALASCPAPAVTSSARGHQHAPLIARHALPSSTGANRLSASSITLTTESDGLGALHLRQGASQPAGVVSRAPIGSNPPAVSGASQDIDVSYGITRSSFPGRTQMVSSAGSALAPSSPHVQLRVIANYMLLYSMPPIQFCQGHIPARPTCPPCLPGCLLLILSLRRLARPNRPPRLPGRLLRFFSHHLPDRLPGRILTFFSPRLLDRLPVFFSPHLPDEIRPGT